MNLVIDTNVFISALIKDNLIRFIIENYNLNILFPEFEFIEIERYKEEIISKSELTEEGFNTLLLRPEKYSFCTLPVLTRRNKGYFWGDQELDTLCHSSPEFLTLLKRVRIVPSDMITSYKDKAKEIMDPIDSDDTPFISTALLFNCPIWSEDKHFKRQNKVKVYTTRELKELLKIL